MVSCRRVLSDTLTATCRGRLTPWQELASLKEAETGSAPREMTYDQVGQSVEMLLQMLRLAFRRTGLGQRSEPPGRRLRVAQSRQVIVSVRPRHCMRKSMALEAPRRLLSWCPPRNRQSPPLAIGTDASGAG